MKTDMGVINKEYEHLEQKYKMSQKENLQLQDSNKMLLSEITALRERLKFEKEENATLQKQQGECFKQNQTLEIRVIKAEEASKNSVCY